jgi:hypothetical protein
MAVSIPTVSAIRVGSVEGAAQTSCMMRQRVMTPNRHAVHRDAQEVSEDTQSVIRCASCGESAELQRRGYAPGPGR